MEQPVSKTTPEPNPNTPVIKGWRYGMLLTKAGAQSWDRYKRLIHNLPEQPPLELIWNQGHWRTSDEIARPIGRD